MCGGFFGRRNYILIIIVEITNPRDN